MTRTFFALLVASALIAAACGGDNPGLAPGNPSSETEPGEVDVEEAYLAFVRCMRDEGFEIEDPTVDADGNVHVTPPAGDVHVSPEELQEVASGACGKHLQRVTQTFQHDDETEQQDSLLAFARCMRDQGVDYSGPDPSGPRAGIHQLSTPMIPRSCISAARLRSS